MNRCLRDSSGNHEWIDSSGNIIPKKGTITGREEFDYGDIVSYQYDENGKLRFRKMKGIETWFDDNEDIIVIKEYYEDGKERFLDKHRREIRRTQPNGFYKIYEYDDRDNIIYHKKQPGKFFKKGMTLDQYKERLIPTEWWYEYDDSNELIREKQKHGEGEIIMEYKDKKRVYMKTSIGREIWWEYDKNGNVIHSYDSEGYKEWFEYDSEGTLKKYRDSKGNSEKK